MENEKNAELEKILSELNTNIKKEHEAGATKIPEKAEEKSGKKNTDAPTEHHSGADKTDVTALKKSGKKSSFAERSRILEQGDAEEQKKPAVKHIAVTAVEIVEDEGTESKQQPEPRIKPSAEGENQPIPEKELGHLPRPSRKKRVRMTRREKLTALFGLILSVFVVVGIVTTVMGAVNLTKELVNSTAQKKEFERIIFPLVIIDVPEFDDPQSLDNSAIISSAIWAFIIDDNDKSIYPKADFGEMTVPDVDIDPYIRKLYGNDVAIEHQMVNSTNVEMLYDAENHTYLIETTPRFLPYTPRVDSIGRDGDIYTLRVSYVLPDALWNLESDHKNAKVDKVMEYRLQRTDNGYQILSVKLLELTGQLQPDNTSQTVPPPEEDYFPEESLPESEETVSIEETEPSGSPASEE